MDPGPLDGKAGTTWHCRAHLDVVVEGLAVLSLEFRSNFQHVHFTAGDHDSDQDLITSSLALKVKQAFRVTIHQQCESVSVQ